MRAVRHDCAEIAARRGVAITEELVNADEPAQSSAHIVKVLEKVCAELGVAAKKMVSRAYHDSLFMARVAPIAMMFIPCRGGVSHRPDEYAATGRYCIGSARTGIGVGAAGVGIGLGIEMAIASINPANGKLLRSFTPLDEEAVRQRIALAAEAFRELCRGAAGASRAVYA